MKTYQDWLEIAERSEEERMTFILSSIKDYKTSSDYINANIGEDYFNAKNTTIRNYEKWLYDAQGQKMPDDISANHKLASRFFYRVVTQANAVLLGNGIKWKNGKGGKALGIDFDRQVIDAGRFAQVQGKSYGFFNVDHVDIFPATMFRPFVDEEDGMIKAGIRFWQLDDNKPLRATLFEIDGFTEYRFKDGKGEIIQPKRGYKAKITSTEADGDQVEEYENYPSFPIVPLYANDLRESELAPLRAKIDAVDLITSGYASDQDDCNTIFWAIEGAGGMSDADLVTVLDKLKKLHATQLGKDQTITPNQVEAPYSGREAILDRLEKELYMDAMAFNPYDIASGAATATQIEAAYDPLDEKLDIYERHISEFISRLLELAGVQDEPTYERNYHTNKGEIIGNIINGAMYLDDQYVTEKIMTLLGDKDKVQDVLDRRASADIQRLTGGNNGNTEGEQTV
jgi:hypothetical protein